MIYTNKPDLIVFTVSQVEEVFVFDDHCYATAACWCLFSLYLLASYWYLLALYWYRFWY
jgi:hypothetical protein